MSAALSYPPSVAHADESEDASALAKLNGTRAKTLRGVDMSSPRDLAQALERPRAHLPHHATATGEGGVGVLHAGR